MDLLRFIPVKLTILLAAGILISKYWKQGPYLPAIITVAGLILMAILCLRRGREADPLFALAASSSIIGLGMLCYSLSLPATRANHYARYTADRPGLFTVKIREELKTTRYSERYIADIKQVDNRPAEGKILLSINRDPSHVPIAVDDELQLHATLQPIRPALNPYQFDYSLYMQGLGIYDQIRANKASFCRVSHPATTLPGMAARLRGKISRALAAAGTGQEELSIIEALLLGQRNSISSETYDAYKNAGAVHILAVSGLHIGILLWILHFLLKPLERLPGGRKIKLLFLLLLLWSYALLAGLSPSVIRAVSMFSFVAYALCLNRPSNAYNILALSMFFVLLVFSPRLLFQAGFQMSYAAVFSILWIHPRLQALWRPRHELVRKTWQLLCVSLAAQLGVFPTSLYYFHQFPGLFFLSSLLIIPLLGILLGAGFLIVLLALFNLLPPALAGLYGNLIGAMNGLVGWIGRQEAFIFRNLPFDLPKLICCYIIITGFVALLSGITYKKTMVLLSGLIALQLWAGFRTMEVRGKEGVWIMHDSRNTMLFHQTGRQLDYASKNGEVPENLLAGFRVGAGIKYVKQQPLAPAYQWEESRLYLVDGKLPIPSFSDDTVYLLLVNSPRIHLGRILEASHPVEVIADGSNYPSFVARWRASCEALNIPFHYTAKKGAYELPLE